MSQPTWSNTRLPNTQFNTVLMFPNCINYYGHN